MSTSTLRSPGSINACLADVAAFANRHPGIREVVMRRINDPLAVLHTSTPRFTVPVLEGGWHETLTDIVVAARRDGIAVTVDHVGGFVYADLCFDGLTVRALDYHTTSEARSALECLAGCSAAGLAGVEGGAVFAFVSAHEAYIEACPGRAWWELSAADSDELECLRGVAEERWSALVAAGPEAALPSWVREVGVGYGRSKIVGGPVNTDWQRSVGTTDWSRGRA